MSGPFHDSTNDFEPSSVADDELQSVAQDRLALLIAQKLYSVLTSLTEATVIRRQPRPPAVHGFAPSPASTAVIAELQTMVLAEASVPFVRAMFAPAPPRATPAQTSQRHRDFTAAVAQQFERLRRS